MIVQYEPLCLLMEMCQVHLPCDTHIMNKLSMYSKCVKTEQLLL